MYKVYKMHNKYLTASINPKELCVTKPNPDSQTHNSLQPKA